LSLYLLRDTSRGGTHARRPQAQPRWFWGACPWRHSSEHGAGREGVPATARCCRGRRSMWSMSALERAWSERAAVSECLV